MVDRHKKTAKLLPFPNQESIRKVYQPMSDRIDGYDEALPLPPGLAMKD